MGEKKNTFISTLKEKGPREKMVFVVYSTNAASQHFSYLTVECNAAIKVKYSVLEASG